MSGLRILINTDLKIPDTIYEVDEESQHQPVSSDKHFQCKDENCPFLHFAKQICESPKRKYSLFVVSLNPFRFVIARRLDGEFHPKLNHEFTNLIKQGIFVLRDIFSEWYDIVFDYNSNITFILYYHNLDLHVNGFFDIYTGNSYNYHYSRRQKYWKTHIWNMYSCMLLYDEPGRKFEFNNNLIAICQNLAQKYDYTTLKIEFDNKSHILTQTK